MVRRVIEVSVVLLFLVVVAAIGAARIWPEPGHGFWWQVAGLARFPDDFGPLDISQVTRRATPSDALVCPESYCQKTKPDIVAPLFGVPAAELRRKLSIVAQSEPRTAELPCSADCGKSARFVQYSALFMFPDTIDVKVLDAGASSSTLAMYSRSLAGAGDQGVNRARLERWLAGLARITPLP